MAIPKVKTFTQDDLRSAKKAGFRRKKPKKPRTKTHAAMSSYISRYNQWVEDLKAKAKEGRELGVLRKELDKVK